MRRQPLESTRVVGTATSASALTVKEERKLCYEIQYISQYTGRDDARRRRLEKQTSKRFPAEKKKAKIGVMMSQSSDECDWSEKYIGSDDVIICGR